MVLNFDSGQDRAQVLLLMGVIVGLLLIGGAILLNYGQFANLDRSSGYSTTTTSSNVIATVESNTQTTLVESNRGDLDFTTEHQEQFNLLSQDLQFSQVDLEASISETVTGRILTTSNGELTGDGNSEWTVFTSDTSDLITGGIAIDAANNTLPVTDDPESNGALHVKTQSHDIYIYRPSDDSESIEALYVGGSRSTYRATSDGDPYLDLGEGSFDGKLFEDYDQSGVRSVDIQNGHRANGSVEFVVTGASSTHPSITNRAATFGAVVDIEVTSNTETTERSIFVTHGPTRGGV